jgi:hypothetical protein
MEQSQTGGRDRDVATRYCSRSASHDDRQYDPRRFLNLWAVLALFVFATVCGLPQCATKDLDGKPLRWHISLAIDIPGLKIHVHVTLYTAPSQFSDLQ